MLNGWPRLKLTFHPADSGLRQVQPDLNNLNNTDIWREFTSSFSSEVINVEYGQ